MVATRRGILTEPKKAAAQSKKAKIYGKHKTAKFSDKTGMDRRNEKKAKFIRERRNVSNTISDEEIETRIKEMRSLKKVVYKITMGKREKKYEVPLSTIQELAKIIRHTWDTARRGEKAIKMIESRVRRHKNKKSEIAKITAGNQTLSKAKKFSRAITIADLEKRRARQRVAKRVASKRKEARQREEQEALEQLQRLRYRS